MRDHGRRLLLQVLVARGRAVLPSRWYFDAVGVRRCVHCDLKRCIRQIGGSVLCQPDGRGEVATTAERAAFHALVAPE